MPYACGGSHASIVYSVELLSTTTTPDMSTHLPDAESSITMPAITTINTKTTMPDQGQGTTTTPSFITTSDIGRDPVSTSEATAAKTDNQQLSSENTSPSVSSGITGDQETVWNTAKTVGLVVGGVAAVALTALGAYFLVTRKKAAAKDRASSIVTWGNSASEEPLRMSEHITSTRGSIRPISEAFHPAMEEQRFNFI